jgi:biopolymer transport protein ExbD
MAFKRRNKVSAGFSMSSMTDIVFLLLIFFMITSTLVHPNALKLFMPRSTEQVSKPVQKYVTVRLTSAGQYYVNNEIVSEAGLLDVILTHIEPGGERFINLTTDKGVSTREAVKILNLAKDNNIQIALNIK